MTSPRARTKLVALASAAAVASLAGAGCSKTHRYESACQIVRKEIVEQDDSGAPAIVDFELEWDACPGDQFQVIRGDKQFAACTAKYEVGDEVPVIVRHWWDARGYYRWDIERVGDCPRAIETKSFGSYEKSQECDDVEMHGRVAGFVCSRKPFKTLVQRCPWMARQ